MIAHDPSLVILSTTIAILGAFTASVMMSGLGTLSRGERRGRLIMASLALGGSLWVMQFVGLLSLEAPLNFAHNPIIACVIGHRRFRRHHGRALPGWRGQRRLSCPSPHCNGSFRSNDRRDELFRRRAIAGRGLTFSWFLALVSIGVSVQVAAIVLGFLFRRRGVLLTLAGSIFLGLCLAASHYLAIASTLNLEQTLLAIPASDNGISERYLAWSATIMMYLICSICLCIFVISQFRDETE